ncbi:MAG TPA: AMP-binding protein, partial [Chitinophagales bacterium]|nr:AMP-binding protein [Chitinophagales bacterium]
MFDWVGKWALTTPNKTALKEAETGRTLSYSEWNNQANTVVHYFSSIGLKKGDRIAILAENCLEYFILFSVCQKMGTILVPLNYRLTSAEINYLLNNASPDLLIVEDKFSQLATATEYYSKLKHGISLSAFTAYCTQSETDLSKVQYPEAV